ncbi:MAG TPA: glycosyltransferase [Candidatus Competibacteraceae bacterium]|nr:glycosyltransferase [Candidatus Competibacteraceae bacterium]
MEQQLIPYQAVTCLGPGPALVLAPHPDDEVFGCGGAIMHHVAAGEAVRVIIVTAGDFGASDSDSPAYVRQRREESRAAAAILGYGEPEFWGLPDRGLLYGEALVQRIVAAARDSGARLIYAPSLQEVHPDHRALAMAAVEAVRRLGGGVALALYEVGVPQWPNRLLDISDCLERKRRAMACFTSQLARQRYDRHIEALNRFRTYTLPGAVEAAEAYRLLEGVSLVADALAPYRSLARRQADRELAVDQFDWPLVSVIVRSRGRDTLAETLDSLALQTYPRIEVVVVDAAGNSPALAALEPWCGRFPLRVEGSGQALGRSAAANLGLERARGELLLFLDDDDWLDPEHIAALAARLADEPQAVAAYAGVRCVRRADDGSLETLRLYNEPYDAARLLVENTIPIHALLFRRRAVEAGCRFDETFDLFEDWDFWLQLAALGPFSHLDRVSAYYRIHGDAGLGVAADEARATAALAQLLEKWRSRWSVRQLQDLVARDRRLAQLLGEVEAQRAAAVQERDTLSVQRDHLQSLLQQTEAQRAALDSRLVALSAELAARQQALESAERDAREWRNRFEWVTGSLSWRLTRPLRRGNELARATVRRGAALGWRTALWAYRQPWLRPVMARVPFGLKQRLRGFLRRGELPLEAAQPALPPPGELLVSIVIPVYNHAEYLERCIVSALQQSYPHVEVIAVDDASPDARVREILGRLEGHPRLKVLYNERNLGIARTQNRALAASRGTLIGFLDCDDYLTADAVERCVRAWHPGIVYLHTGRVNIDEQDREVSRISFEHLPRRDYFAENLERMFATHFKVIRRDAFAKVGLFDPRFDSAQDYDMLMRIAFHYPSSAFLHLPEFVYYHRFHERQATERMNARQQWSTATIQREARLRQSIREGRFDRFLSIVMLSFGKHRQTLEAIESLQQTVKVPHEIILFDNGSDAETVEFLKTHIDGRFPDVRVVYHPTNLGPAAGRREALKLARGDWFLVFDNDERAEPGWLEELLVRALSQPEVGAVCCRVVFPNRRLQFSGGYIRHLDDELIELKLYDQEASVDDLATAEFRELDWSPIGATLFLENPAPYLHAGYPNVFEDAGVSLALRRQGKRLLNSPGSWVWHDHYMFRKEVDMKERYLQHRYDPQRMLVSVASFYRENGMIIRDEYIWRENRLFDLDRGQLKALLERQPQAA